MRQRIYYLAFLNLGNWEYPRYGWFTDLIDPNEVEQRRMEIQINHMKNRIQGAWRWQVPFEISWKLGNMEFFTYEI
jgi:hypothetical protein